MTTFDLTYGSRLIEKFDKVMLESFKIFNVSPLRILEARIDSNDREFTVYSGVHSFAPALSKYVSNPFNSIFYNFIFLK